LVCDVLTGRRDDVTSGAFEIDADSECVPEPAIGTIAAEAEAAAAVARMRSAPSSICKGHISVRPFAAIVDIWTVNS
jgi:hypothetical protein